MKTINPSMPFGKLFLGAAILLSASLLHIEEASAQTINIGPNQYAFRFTQNPNYGLFFNAANVQYEFRNGTAAPIFAFNADNGNMTTNLQFASGNNLLVAPGNYAFRSPAAPNAGIFFGATDYELRTTTGAAAFSLSAINSNAVFAGTITAPGGGSTQWNQAHGWGNHASAGYISSEVDPKISANLSASSVPRWTGTQLAGSSISAGGENATITGTPSTAGTTTSPGGSLLTLRNPGGGVGFSSLESRLSFVKGDTQRGNIRTSGNNFVIESLFSGQLLFRAGNQDRITIASNGNVGIGTVAVTGARLAVAGQVLATQVKVQAQSNWPDYVFEENYDLMSIDELGQYVKSQKHLPGLPSALDLEKAEGVELGEMQRLTIEKVEELTLYILELKLRSDELSSENAALRSRIESLEGK
jgi:hypothetical protein